MVTERQLNPDMPGPDPRSGHGETPRWLSDLGEQMRSVFRHRTQPLTILDVLPAETQLEARLVAAQAVRRIPAMRRPSED